MEHDFSKGSMGSNILKQAVPLTIAQLVLLLYNIVDRIYIGHLPNSDGLALTGIGLTIPIISFVSACTGLFGMGGAPLCSIARGAGNIERAEKIQGLCAYLLFFSSFIIMAICYIFEKQILHLFGASDATYEYAQNYLVIYLLGTVFVMFGSGMNYFINSQGFPKIGMFTVMIGAVTNIILDPIFIFLLGMGIKGAAVATVISQFISALWVFRFLTSDKAILKIKRQHFKFDLSLTKSVCKLGFSTFIMNATNCTVQVVCNLMLKGFNGDLYIGIMTVLNSVREIVGLPVSGVTSGSQPVLGFNYGAKEYKRVRQGILFITKCTVIYSFLAWLAIMAVPELWIKIFNSNPDTVLYGSQSLKIYFFGFFMMAFQFSGQSIFVALGKSRQAIFFSLLRKVFIVVPLTIMLPKIPALGVNGVFLAEPISNALGGIACYTTMYFIVWKELKLKEHKNI